MRVAWGVVRLVLVSKDEFADFDLGGAEVDQHGVFSAGGAEVAEDLGGVVVVEGAAGFEFDDEIVVYDEVGEELAEEAAVLVVDVDGDLLVDLLTKFSKAVAEGVFVYLFVVSVAEETVGVEGGLADDVGELSGVLFGHETFCVFCAFCGQAGIGQSTGTTDSGAPPAQR